MTKRKTKGESGVSGRWRGILVTIGEQGEGGQDQFILYEMNSLN